MTATRRVTALLVPVLALLAIIYGLFQGNRAHVSAASLADATEARDAARAQQRRAEEQLRERERTAAERKEATAAAVAKTATDRAKEPNPPAARSTLALIAATPSLREMSLKGTQRLPDYGPKVWVLKMTPEQIAKMKAFNYQIESAKLDLVALAEAQGLSMDHPEIRKMDHALDAEMREKMTALLGPADAERYYAFAPDWRLQTMVDQVAGNVYLSDAPVTLGYEQEMVRILRQNAVKDEHGGRYLEAVTQGRFDLASVTAQMSAAGIPPVQIAALRTIIERNRASYEVKQMIDEAMTRNPAAKNISLNLPAPALPRR